MSKYTSYVRKKTTPSPRDLGVNPVMRGIGCILMVVVPVLSYGIAIMLVNIGAARGWPIPPNWFGPPTIHPLLWKLQGLETILFFLQGQNNLEANLVFTVVVAVILGGIMTLIFGWTYALLGPPQYGPQDAPPVRGVRVKRYKR